MQGFSAAASKGLTSGLVGPSTDAGRQSGQGFVTGLGSALQSGGQRIAGIGDSLTRGLTLPLVGLGAVAFNASKQFNEGMANVATLIPGNTARVEELSSGVRELAVDMGTSTDDMTEGLYGVISAFGDSSQSMSLLEINAKAAKAGMAETSDAISLTAAVTKGYGDTSQEAVQKASDLALLTVRMGETNFPDLAGSIGQVIPMAQNLGVAQEELFAGMATFTGVTGSASEVATQMRAALQGLMAPTTDGAKAIEEAGFASGKAAVEELGLAGAVGILTDAADESGQPLQNFMGQVEGQTFAMGLAGAQAEKYETSLAEMGNAAGVTDEALTETTEGVNAAGFEWDQAKSKANDLMIELGNALTPAITSLVDSAGPLITGMSALATAFSEADPATQKWITSLLGVAIALGPVMSIVGRITSTVGGIVKGLATFGRGTAAVARGSARMGSAIGRAGAAGARGLGRLSSGFRDARAAESSFSGRMGTIGGKMRQAVNWFGRLGAAAARAAVRVVAAGARMAAQAAAATARVVAQIVIQIARWAVLAASALASAASVALAWVISMGPIILVAAAVAGLVALVVIHFDTIKNAIETAFNWIVENWQLLLTILTGPFGAAVWIITAHKDKIVGAIQAAIDWVKTNWPTILAVLTGPIGIAVLVIAKHWGTIKDGATAVKDWITSKFNSLVGFIGRLGGRISSKASGMFDGIKSAFKSAINAIIRWWNNISFTLPSIDIPSADIPGLGTIGGGTLGGQTFSTPNIPTLHDGGIFTASGGEGVARLADGEGVFTRSQMAALAPVAQPAPRDDLLVLDVRGGEDELTRLVRKWVRTRGGGDVQSLAGRR